MVNTFSKMISARQPANPSQLASQPASEPAASQPASRKGKQPISQHASQPSSQPVSQLASQRPGSHPPKQASQPASRHASQPASGLHWCTSHLDELLIGFSYDLHRQSRFCVGWPTQPSASQPASEPASRIFIAFHTLSWISVVFHRFS